MSSLEILQKTAQIKKLAEEISTINNGLVTLTEKQWLEDKKEASIVILELAFDGFKMIYGQTQSDQEREDVVASLDCKELRKFFYNTSYAVKLEMYLR